MGINVEKEHGNVWNLLKSYLDKHNIEMAFNELEFYELIAKSHLREIPDYYTRFKIVEKDKKL